MLFLGIETSCDETAAAIVEHGTSIRSSVVSSQVDLHARYGGVVPEIASRAHVDLMVPVIAQARPKGSCRLPISRAGSLCSACRRYRRCTSRFSPHSPVRWNSTSSCSVHRAIIGAKFARAVNVFES